MGGVTVAFVLGVLLLVPLHYVRVRRAVPHARQESARIDSIRTALATASLEAEVRVPLEDLVKQAEQAAVAEYNRENGIAARPLLSPGEHVMSALAANLRESMPPRSGGWVDPLSLPTTYSSRCRDCDWVEVSRLGSAVPEFILGQPCDAHSGKPLERVQLSTGWECAQCAADDFRRRYHL